MLGAMSLYDIALTTLEGEPTTLRDHAGKALLIVNVASKCGLTPQYTALEAMHEQLRRAGLRGARLPVQPVRRPGAGHRRGDPDVLLDELRRHVPDVREARGQRAGRHPLYAELTQAPDTEGYAGDIRWNFEKFLLSPDGEIAARFAPMVTPDDATVVAAVEANLP